MTWTSTILITSNLAFSYCKIIACNPAIWHSCIAKCTLAIWRLYIALSLLTIWRSCIPKWHCRFGNILLLSSNNIVSSFFWISRRKHCFLTSFSNLNWNFLFQVFSRNRYLLVSLSSSQLQENRISHPVFSYFWYTKVLLLLCCMCAPYFWHTSRIFSKQDACGNLVLELVPVFFPHSAFFQRFLMWTSIEQLRIIPFLLP